MGRVKEKYRIELSDVQKRSLFKVAVDLVKVDKQIHRNEISLLDELQRVCDINDQAMEMIHYTTLSQAVNVLRGVEDKRLVIAVLREVIGIDNDIDQRESMLFSALCMALEEESQSWCSVVSSVGMEAECSDRQIVYLEKRPCEESRKVLEDRYDNLLLSKALTDVGLQLFYIPNVVEELGQHWDSVEKGDGKLGLLRRSMEFIVPAGDRTKLANLGSVLRKLDSETFYRVLSSNYNLTPEQIPFEAFLMVKIQDNYVLDDDERLQKAVDFLCIDISRDVKKRILHFVEHLEKPTCKLSYEGYYRILYDFLSSESRIVSSLLFDAKNDLRLTNLGDQKVAFESAPQAKTLYLLLLRYGSAGVSQECFERAYEFLEKIDNQEFILEGEWDMELFRQKLLRLDTDWSHLIYNLLLIYGAISTKDAEDEGFVRYIATIIRHRSSLKNYINKGFGEVEQLANKEWYSVQFNRDSKSYILPLSWSLVSVWSSKEEAEVPIVDSDLWNRLLV